MNGGIFSQFSCFFHDYIPVPGEDAFRISGTGITDGFGILDNHAEDHRVSVG